MILRQLGIEKMSNRSATMIFAICLAFSLCFGTILNTHVSIYSFRLGNYWHFCIAAITGSIAMMLFCKTVLDRDLFVSNLSRYSVLFLGSQYFLLMPFKRIIAKLGIKNWTYDVFMVVTIAIYIIVLPRVYELLKKRLLLIRCFNGEYE